MLQAQNRATQQQKALDGMKSEVHNMQLQKDELARQIDDASAQVLQLPAPR